MKGQSRMREGTHDRGGEKTNQETHQTRKLTSRTKNTWERPRRTSSGIHMGSTWQNAWELTRTENTGSKMETVKRVTEMREGKECGVDSGLLSDNEYGR